MFAPATQELKQPVAVATAEEEALKRNTDCVYFLASPLTCKKGRECEYRHSEYARVNPRDCYYWMNGNCLNPKCGFRHPPLDGLMGNQGGAPADHVHPSHAQAPHGVGKQAASCVFFQKGMCIKGDRCAFVHMPVPGANKMQQPVEHTHAAEFQSSKKPFEMVTEEKKFVPSVNFSMACKVHADMGAAAKVANFGLVDSRNVERYVPQHVGYETVPQKTAVGVSLFSGGGLSPQFIQTHGYGDSNTFQNGTDPDDVLRESSPGLDVGEDFDVIVDSRLRDSEYYRGEDHFERRGEDGRTFADEHDSEFDVGPDGDTEARCDHRDFDRMQDGRYGWGHHRASSPERVDLLERRVYPAEERSERIPESDLRHRLSKHRRGNGPRSERGFADSRRDTLQESSISSRFQGRIKLPGRANGGDGQFERGMEWGRNRNELSQGRQGRLRDRIKGRLEENHCNDEESCRHAPSMRRRRGMEGERNSEFPAPKRLAELRSEKDESKPEPSLRKRKSLEDHRTPKSEEGSFVAPLPFSEILKRKRAAATTASGGSGDEKSDMLQETKQEDRDAATAKEEGGDEPEPAAGDKRDESSEPKQTREAEADEGIMVEEGVAEDQGYEGDDQNIEYYYEQGYTEDGEYNYEEGAEEEFAEEGVEIGEAGEGEEDGGNEFAEKMGVMF